ncbi:MAG: DUF4358 domain-containing protein [Ruminococcus sp.]|nr:DUF4358 domain-containing protein [Ruminococcus sp.]
MKNFGICLLSLILSLCMLTACGTADVDLQTVFDDINSQFGIEGITVIEDVAKLNRYYMIEEDTVEQFAAEFSAESSVYKEIVLVKAVDEASASEIATLLNNHYQSRLSEAKSYNPESVAMLENCSVEQNGVYVSLIIDENAADIKAVYDSYFE